MVQWWTYGSVEGSNSLSSCIRERIPDRERERERCNIKLIMVCSFPVGYSSHVLERDGYPCVGIIFLILAYYLLFEKKAANGCTGCSHFEKNPCFTIVRCNKQCSYKAEFKCLSHDMVKQILPMNKTECRKNFWIQQLGNPHPHAEHS